MVHPKCWHPHHLISFLKECPPAQRDARACVAWEPAQKSRQMSIGANHSALGRCGGLWRTEEAPSGGLTVRGVRGSSEDVAQGNTVQTQRPRARGRAAVVHRGHSSFSHATAHSRLSDGSGGRDGGRGVRTLPHHFDNIDGPRGRGTCAARTI